MNETWENLYDSDGDREDMVLCLYCEKESERIKDFNGEMVCFDCRLDLLDQEFERISCAYRNPR